MRSSVDIAIIGGGPAGLSAAIGLARAGANVVVFDVCSRSDAQGRVETLDGEGTSLLANLGVTMAIASARVIPSRGVSSVWGSATAVDRPSMLNPLPNAIHLNRGALKSGLATVARRVGVRLHLGGRAKALFNSGKWLVSAPPLSVSALGLVVATGRSSLPIQIPMRRYFFDRLVGVFASALSNSHHSDYRDWLRLEAFQFGWLYSCPINDSTIQLALMTDIEFVRKYLLTNIINLKSQLTTTSVGSNLDVERVHSAPVAASTFIRSPLSENNIVLIGDAAFAIDPLSGQGLVSSIASGLNASKIFVRPSSEWGEALVNYEENVIINFEKLLNLRSAIYA